MFSYENNIPPYINIVLGVVAFVWLLLRTSNRWPEYPLEVKLHLTATLAFILALLETSAEQIAHDVPTSFNTIIITAAKVFLLFVLWRTRGALYRTGTREPGNGDEISPDRDITASQVSADSEQGPQPVEQEGDRL